MADPPDRTLPDETLAKRLEVPGGWTAELIEQMQVLNPSTLAGPLDLTMVPAGTGGYEDLAGNKRDIEYRE